jgi:hypothetical protein
MLASAKKEASVSRQIEKIHHLPTPYYTILTNARISDMAFPRGALEPTLPRPATPMFRRAIRTRACLGGGVCAAGFASQVFFKCLRVVLTPGG